MNSDSSIYRLHTRPIHGRCYDLVGSVLNLLKTWVIAPLTIEILSISNNIYKQQQNENYSYLTAAFIYSHSLQVLMVPIEKIVTNTTWGTLQRKYDVMRGL